MWRLKSEFHNFQWKKHSPGTFDGTTKLIIIYGTRGCYLIMFLIRLKHVEGLGTIASSVTCKFKMLQLDFFEKNLNSFLKKSKNQLFKMKIFWRVFWTFLKLIFPTSSQFIILFSKRDKVKTLSVKWLREWGGLTYF